MEVSPPLPRSHGKAPEAWILIPVLSLTGCVALAGPSSLRGGTRLRGSLSSPLTWPLPLLISKGDTNFTGALPAKCPLLPATGYFYPSMFHRKHFLSWEVTKAIFFLRSELERPMQRERWDLATRCAAALSGAIVTGAGGRGGALLLTWWHQGFLHTAVPPLSSSSKQAVMARGSDTTRFLLQPQGAPGRVDNGLLSLFYFRHQGKSRACCAPRSWDHCLLGATQEAEPPEVEG